MKVRDIRLYGRTDSLVNFANASRNCLHCWERHLWDKDEAYCAKCGSFATVDDSPSGETQGGRRWNTPGDGSRSKK